MARNARRPVKAPFRAWQWNCCGYRVRKAALQQYITQTGTTPDAIMLQETLRDDIRFPGYRACSAPIAQAGPKKGRGVCTLVRKGIKYVERDLAQNTPIEHVFTEILIGRRTKRDSLFLLNIYNGPGRPYNGLRALLLQASRLAGKHPLIVGGDFNAENQTWGYRHTTANATEAGLTLITDPTQPTRIGTSTALDTTPDLTFLKTPTMTRDCQWSNIGENLGSDHYIIETQLSLQHPPPSTDQKRTFTDWDLFRKHLVEDVQDIHYIDQWTEHVIKKQHKATQEIETEENIHMVDSRLAHLLEAKRSIQNRWKRQRLNKKLRRRVAQLNATIAAHCESLCKQH